MGSLGRGSSIRIIAATVTVMGVVCVACFGSAYASRIVKVASHITIKSHHNGTFTGRVTSSDPGCASDGRRVTLYTTSKLKLGTANTNIHGQWKVKASGFAGISLHHFFAKVAKFPNGAAGTIYLCGAARSKTVSFQARPLGGIPSAVAAAAVVSERDLKNLHKTQPVTTQWAKARARA